MKNRNLIPKALIAAFSGFIFGCSAVTFSDSSAQIAESIAEEAQGVVKISYIFVKRTADILFVIDTSGSMAEEQILLKSGFPSFTTALKEYSTGTLDWHVAITTTDVFSAGDGKQGALVTFSRMPAGTYFLDSSMDIDEANAAFQDTVTLGVSGSGDERGIAAAVMAMQKEFDPGATRGFIRPDTSLSVIVLSDEDERSTRDSSSQEYKPLEPIDEPDGFVSSIRAMDTMSSAPKTITFHSIVTSSQACLAGAGASMGEVYMDLSRRTNGIIGDICALTNTYQEQLASLAANIVNEARTYTLPCNKIVEGSAVAYEQQQGGALIKVPSTFVPPNKLVLDKAPPVGSLIKARFNCLDSV